MTDGANCLLLWGQGRGPQDSPARGPREGQTGRRGPTACPWSTPCPGRKQCHHSCHPRGLCPQRGSPDQGPRARLRSRWQLLSNSKGPDPSKLGSHQMCGCPQVWRTVLRRQARPAGGPAAMIPPPRPESPWLCTHRTWAPSSPTSEGFQSCQHVNLTRTQDTSYRGASSPAEQGSLFTHEGPGQLHPSPL